LPTVEDYQSCLCAPTHVEANGHHVPA
jgi:hypothetical protein